MSGECHTPTSGTAPPPKILGSEVDQVLRQSSLGSRVAEDLSKAKNKEKLGVGGGQGHSQGSEARGGQGNNVCPEASSRLLRGTGGDEGKWGDSRVVERSEETGLGRAPLAWPQNPEGCRRGKVPSVVGNLGESAGSLGSRKGSFPTVVHSTFLSLSLSVGGVHRA